MIFLFSSSYSYGIIEIFFSKREVLVVLFGFCNLFDDCVISI